MPNRHPIPPLPVEPIQIDSLEPILERLGYHGRPYNEEFLRQVYEFSAEMHRDQKRRSGEPYFNHPLSVAYLLAAWKLDQICVVVGLLHDVVEDTPVDQVGS